MAATAPRTLARQALRLSTSTSTSTSLRTSTPIRRSITHAALAPRAPRPATPTAALASLRRRDYSTATATPTSALEPPDHLDDRELHIFSTIKSAFNPTQLEVQDVSGGCGSMYALEITAEAFRGLTVIKQHRLVNAALREEIAGWHGVQLKTRAP